jgi:hypothetical protein
MTTTKSTTQKAATKTEAEVTNDFSFEILDSEPEFRKAQGRAKSALRLAMESLPLGKSMVAAEVSSDALLNSTRQKAQEIRSHGKTEGLDIRFGVRVDVEGRIIVTRKS